MKLLLINGVCGIRSTGRIVADIAREYEDRGWTVKIAYGREPYVPEECKKWAVYIGNSLSVMLHGVFTRLFDLHGSGPCSLFSTMRFLKWAQEYNPDVLWLHNIHGYYLNYELLFQWIKKRPDMEVRWTIHSCWAFTGHCGYFTFAGCEKWKNGCKGDCPCRRNYPSTFGITAAAKNWERKRRAFLGVKKMTLVSPSKWLASLMKESFLSVYEIAVNNNKIDTDIFRPTKGNFRERYGLQEAFIILGVASTWETRKGLDDFLGLAKVIDEKMRIVLVGLSAKQIYTLPSNVIGITKTNNAKELAEIYSTADVFFNPTREENYPTVNLEARACGCKIVTYDTGGCAETVEGYDNAFVLKGDDKTPKGFMQVLSKIIG